MLGLSRPCNEPPHSPQCPQWPAQMGNMCYTTLQNTVEQVRAELKGIVGPMAYRAAESLLLETGCNISLPDGEESHLGLRVYLQIHCVPNSPGVQGCDTQGLWYEVHCKPVWPHLTNRQADAINCYEALWQNIAHPSLGHLHRSQHSRSKPPRIPLRPLLPALPAEDAF